MEWYVVIIIIIVSFHLSSMHAEYGLTLVFISSLSLYSLQIKMGDIFKEVTISEATETSLSLFHDIAHLDLQSELQSQINEMQIKTYRLAW